LVYDDICTTGGQLDVIADYLLDQGGAARVEGVVLARAPWRTGQYTFAGKSPGAI
jgi:predicted amidophosphoribosyltransferase